MLPALRGRGRSSTEKSRDNDVRPTDITVQAPTDNPEDGHAVEITRGWSVDPWGAGAARPQGKRRDRQAPKGSALDTYGNNPSTAGQGVATEGAESRASRYQARRAIQPLMEGPAFRNLRACGRTSVLTGGEVTVKVSGRGGHRSAGFGGLATCGSVWACPVCSAKIAVRRASEVEQALNWNVERGGTVVFATLTVRHRRGQSLSTLWNDALRAGWDGMTKGRPWRELRKLLGFDHYIRATEVTHGDHGWHAHFHLLLLCQRGISQDMADAFASELSALWIRALDKHGFEALEQGQDVRIVDPKAGLRELGDYFAKQVYRETRGMAFEGAGGRFKKGRRSGRTPFQILEDFLATGLADDFDLWEEYARVSKGRRQLTWSRGLKAAAGVDSVTDEEIAAEELNGETMITLPRSSWKVVFHVAEALLDTTERWGVAGAVKWLRARELRFRLSDAGYAELGETPSLTRLRCNACFESLDDGTEINRSAGVHERCHVDNAGVWEYLSMR